MKICYSCFRELPAGAKVCPRCGCSTDLKNEEDHPHALPCGSVLNGRYIVGRVLGQGGFGITYAGWQSDPGEPVAIKEFFPEMLALRDASRSVIPFSTGKKEDFEYGKNQFLEEAKTLSAFIGSPNIVRVHSYFEENGTAYFAMEYVQGKSLKQYVESRGGRIPWEEAWKLLMPVLDALSEVHFRGLIHRDIKPENIIITKSGSAKLIDFGAARYSCGERSSSLDAVLTPGYAPPEQYYRRGNQGSWTDVYALAATMYYCITGIVPPEAVERTYGDSLEKPSSLGISIPDYVETALLKALSLKKEDRFQTTYDLRNDILSKMEPPKEGGKATGEIIKKPEPEAEKPKRILPAAAAIAVIAVIVSIAVFVVISAIIRKPSSEKSEINSPDNQDEVVEVTDQENEEISSNRASDDSMELTDTWEEIIASSKDGTYKDRYRIGATKELDMGTEGIITMKLVAMDEDELADGSGKAPMTWVADVLLQSEHKMNDDNTSEGGWGASGMRAWLRETILPLMPAEVRRGIREVKKYTYSYEEEKGVITTDAIWIPSEREVFLADRGEEWVNEKEGAAYTEVFKDDDSRIRRSAGTSGAWWWWLRTAYDSCSFKDVVIDGSYCFDSADYEGGVAVGFCL